MTELVPANRGMYKFTPGKKTELRQRSKNTCEVCKKPTPHRLEVHHFFVSVFQASQKQYPREHISHRANALCVCEKCHDAIDKRQSKHTDMEVQVQYYLLQIIIQNWSQWQYLSAQERLALARNMVRSRNR